jgi:hypothetical protein
MFPVLDLHKQLPKAKTPREQESIQRQIATTDKQTDQPVGTIGDGNRFRFTRIPQPLTVFRP